MSHCVAVVVEKDFSQALESLARRVHVWLRRTPTNNAAAERYRLSDPEYSLERGVTTFSVDEEATPEEMLLGVISDADLHHGELSHLPPWDTLEVYGASLTARGKATLEKFGVSTFHATPYGFTCSRSVPSAA